MYGGENAPYVWVGFPGVCRATRGQLWCWAWVGFGKEVAAADVGAPRMGVPLWLPVWLASQ